MRAWAVMAILLLAGCSEEAAEDSLDDAVSKGVELRGVVVDQAIQPLAGATVVLKQSGASNVTDRDGEFRFIDLEPGTYTIEASAPGYLDVVQVGTIRADGTSDVVQIVLPTDTEVVQYVSAYHFQGLFECGFWGTNGCANINILTGIVLCNYGLCLGNVTQDRSVFLQWIDDIPDYIQTELIWEPTSDIGRALSYVLGGATAEELRAGSASGYNNTHGESPLLLSLGDPALNESRIGYERALMTQVWPGATYPVPGGCLQYDPCGVGVVVMQDYEVFTHVFHGYVPVGDWRFSDGTEPPPP